MDLWKNDTPPIIGKSKEDVVKSFKKLKDYDLSKIWVDDKNYPHHIGHIKNFTKVPINQFFPTINIPSFLVIAKTILISKKIREPSTSTPSSA